MENLKIMDNSDDTEDIPMKLDDTLAGPSTSRTDHDNDSDKSDESDEEGSGDQ